MYYPFKDQDCVIVELEDVTATPLRGLQPNHIPIFPQDGRFQVELKKRNRNGKKKKISVKRNHFPIVPRFSMTGHKSQGQTFGKAIIDLVPNPKFKGPLDVSVPYVPLSRVRRLEDLTILREFPESVILNPEENPARKAMMADFRGKDLCKDM